jgi:opacity protein-like surface antigen
MTVQRRSHVVLHPDRRRGRSLCPALLLASLVAAPAAALGPDEQSGPPAIAPAAPAASAQAASPPPQRGPGPATPAATPSGPAISILGFGSAGYTWFAATESFDAVLGSSGGPAWGGGVAVTFAGGRYFAQVSAERFSADGERVFVDEGEVFPLGIPVKVEVTPLEFTAGYRFVPRPPQRRPLPPPPPPRPIFKPANPGAGTRSTPPPPPPARAAAAPTRSWVPYVGGGVGILSYSESSSTDSDTEGTDDSFTSYHVVGGVDVKITRWFGAGVEAAYRWVPGALGEGGVSQEFGEEDLGGATVRVRVIVGR